MTIREFLVKNNLSEESVVICIYDEDGMSPYDDENWDKYFDIPFIKVNTDDEMYNLDFFFLTDDCYGK